MSKKLGTYIFKKKKKRSLLLSKPLSPIPTGPPSKTYTCPQFVSSFGGKWGGGDAAYGLQRREASRAMSNTEKEEKQKAEL